jgi:hypothetical protein
VYMGIVIVEIIIYLSLGSFGILPILPGRHQHRLASPEMLIATPDTPILPVALLASL